MEWLVGGRILTLTASRYQNVRSFVYKAQRILIALRLDRRGATEYSFQHDCEGMEINDRILNVNIYSAG
jgi:hypothetical protein